MNLNIRDQVRVDANVDKLTNERMEKWMENRICHTMLKAGVAIKSLLRVQSRNLYGLVGGWCKTDKCESGKKLAGK